VVAVSFFNDDCANYFDYFYDEFFDYYYVGCGW
jgi:hypothetical protein